MCRSLMGFLALSLGAALSAIFYLKYWIFVFQPNCLSLQWSVTKQERRQNSSTEDGTEGCPWQPDCHRRSGRPSSAAGTQGRRSWTQDIKSRRKKINQAKKYTTRTTRWCLLDNLKGVKSIRPFWENLSSVPEMDAKWNSKSHISKIYFRFI